MRAQPLGEPDHLRVRPHPGRPSREGVQNILGTFSLTTFHIAIDAIAIGPVTLDSHKRKLFFANQVASDLSSPRIKLRRAMRCFAEQDVLRVADRFDEWIEMRWSGRWIRKVAVMIR